MAGVPEAYSGAAREEGEGVPRAIAAIETKRKTGSVSTWKKLGSALDASWGAAHVSGGLAIVTGADTETGRRAIQFLFRNDSECIDSFSLDFILIINNPLMPQLLEVLISFGAILVGSALVN